ncbi:MAG: polysaccharide export protein [Alphaproteobacteria bacterium]|nr:polysaccharide export protein [Alphaproteobacteria bacterium]
MLLPRRRVVLLPALLATAACAPAALPLEDTPPGPYLLGGGDIVQLSVAGDPTLAGLYRVDDTGRISVPLIGAVEIGGRTLRDAEEAINRRFRSEGVLVEPRVNLNIQQYRSIYVMGEVVRGGGYPFEPGMTAIQAVALAGGFTPRASRASLLLLRGSLGEAPRRALPGTHLQAGDVITATERWF